MFDAAFAGSFAVLVGSARRLTGAIFIELTVAVVVDAVAEVVVLSGRFAFAPLRAVAELGVTIADTLGTGRLGVALA